MTYRTRYKLTLINCWIFGIGNIACHWLKDGDGCYGIHRRHDDHFIGLHLVANYKTFKT